jgi:hypothetical protein
MAPSVRQALLDHSEKKLEPAGVMRALVEHDDWYVPIHALQRAPTGPRIDYVPPGKAQLATHQLNVFTDRDAADWAAAKFGGAPLGSYVGQVAGTELFGNLIIVPALAAAQMMQVNPGSDLELQWFVEPNAFSLCAVWSKAVILERAIAAQASGWADAMRMYPGWLVILGKADNALVRVNVREKGEQALIFSAPDLADRFLAGLPNNGGAACKLAPVAGEQLFAYLLKTAVKGFIVNASSAQPRAFDISACRTILGLP